MGTHCRHHHGRYFEERPRHPELRHPDARPDRVWRPDPRGLYVHEFAQLAMYVADVITVQARHIIERRPRFVENGFERRKDVLRLTAKVGRKPSLGVGPDDAGDEDLVADPDCRRILVSFGSRFKRGRYDGREWLGHWVSPLRRDAALPRWKFSFSSRQSPLPTTC